MDQVAYAHEFGDCFLRMVESGLLTVETCSVVANTLFTTPMVLLKTRMS